MNGETRCYRIGRSAVVLDCDGASTRDRQRRILRVMREAASWHGVLDVTAGLQNLTVFFDPLRASGADYERLLAQAWRASTAGDETVEPATVTIEVRYGGAAGPDLAVVAGLHGISEAEIVERHCAGDYVVDFLGFAPGFAYLGGLDPSLHTPRRAVPRARVPAGSVAIGGELTGVYPGESPGGWNLIGRTDRIMFDPDREPAALLAPGDRVRFVAAP